MKVIIFLLGTVLILSIFGCSKNPTSSEITIDINIPDDYPTIQEGINASSDGDVILVAPATYVENISYNGKNITIASMLYTTQDTSYISQTVIDGNNNDSVVKFENGEDATATLCGFTITNGNAYYGGGIKCRDYSSPSLQYLIISNNISFNGGGGIYCKNFSSPYLENVTVLNNFVNYWGGGIYCGNDSDIILENIIIKNNSSGYGGGIYCFDSNPILKNLTITDNSATSWGGGICFSQSIPSLEKTTITNNTSNLGGGVFCHNTNLSLENVTIANNIALTDGGGVSCIADSHPYFVNCILWNNSPEEIYFNGTGEPNSTTIKYSNIDGGESGIVINYNAIVHWLEGNIDINPFFIDSENGDYHLSENSPCIDAGDPTYPFDPDGTIIDMGAFYFIN